MSGLRLKRNIWVLLLSIGWLTYSYSQQIPDKGEVEGLKEVYAEYFDIGASVSPRSLRGDQKAHILQHFNSLTAENDMKMGRLQPHEGQFRWEAADAIVQFARDNGMKVRGHTLCWHNQAPRWFFTDDNGAPVSKDTLLARLARHISVVAQRYRGEVYAWDVVNEAISDSEVEMYRDSPFYKIIGKEFVARAFEYAHQADPDALLFYNDYSAVNPAKREKIVTMLKELLDAGVPVHGMGIQAHWSIYHPTEDELKSAIEAYAALGLDVQITELDVSVYPPESDRRAKRADEKDDFTPEMEAKQVAQYEMIFRVLREYKDEISSVTFWNVSDRYSWLDYFPVRGRKNYPLLFDKDLQPKAAYWKVVEF